MRSRKKYRGNALRRTGTGGIRRTAGRFNIACRASLSDGKTVPCVRFAAFRVFRFGSYLVCTVRVRFLLTVARLIEFPLQENRCIGRKEIYHSFIDRPTKNAGKCTTVGIQLPAIVLRPFGLFPLS